MNVFWRGQTRQANPRFSKQAYLYQALTPYFCSRNLGQIISNYICSTAGENLNEKEFSALHHLEDGSELPDAKACLRADLTDEKCRAIYIWFHDLHQRENASLVLEPDFLANYSLKTDSSENIGPKNHAEKIKAFIFSSVRNLEQFKTLFGCGIPLYYLPYPASSPGYFASPANELRTAEFFRLAFIGSALAEEQAHILCQALRGLTGIRLLWLFTGEELAEARELAARYELRNFEIRETSPGSVVEDWLDILQKSQAICHLLYTGFADPGPFLSLSLASGKPVIGTNFGDLGNLASGVIQHIQIGHNSLEALRQALSSVSISQTPSPAQAYAKEFLAPELVASNLAFILNKT